MNRRELLTAGLAGAAALALPKVARANSHCPDGQDGLSGRERNTEILLDVAFILFGRAVYEHQPLAEIQFAALQRYRYKERPYAWARVELGLPVLSRTLTDRWTEIGRRAANNVGGDHVLDASDINHAWYAPSWNPSQPSDLGNKDIIEDRGAFLFAGLGTGIENASIGEGRKFSEYSVVRKGRRNSYCWLEKNRRITDWSPAYVCAQRCGRYSVREADTFWPLGKTITSTDFDNAWKDVQRLIVRLKRTHPKWGIKSYACS